MQHLTDAQYRVLAAAAARGDAEILRGEDASESTLRSLATKRYATLQYTTVGRRQVVTAARITRGGWAAYSAEADRRAVAERAALLARPTCTPADPFAVFSRSAQARIDARIDAAFAF